MVEVKRNLSYLQVPLRYPRNTVAELFFFNRKGRVFRRFIKEKKVIIYNMYRLKLVKQLAKTKKKLKTETAVDALHYASVPSAVVVAGAEVWALGGG
jgi:hypothetical protein